MKKIILPSWVESRDYMEWFLTTAKDLIASNPEKRHLFSAPTGTGKSICELMLLRDIPNGLFITPRIEIIQGMLEKLNDFDEEWDVDTTVSRAFQYGIITPIRLRNMLAKGSFPYRPSFLCIDECHHHAANTYQDIDMYLNGIPTIGLTATPYRGTPQGTREFYEQWNDTINVILSLSDAVRDGYCSMPTATMVPLVDDDTISLVSGEFKVASVDAVVLDRIKFIAEYSRQFFSVKASLWDRPTMYSVSSTRLCHELTRELNSIGLQAESVTQETSVHSRREIFKRVIGLRSALVQIDVVSEGVDLPIRRLIDLRPTMSPVRWVQQIGRIMRPVKKCRVCSDPYLHGGQKHLCECEPPPEYICCCRNLERHAYLMEGMFPNSTIKEAQEAFEDTEGKPIFSKRAGMRAVGMEGFGKYVITPISLANGTTIFTYQLVRVEGFHRQEFFAIVHPNHPQIIIGEKLSTRNPSTNEYQWGKWKVSATVPELTGCVSAKASPLTPKQVDYWNGTAEAKGLNQHIPPNARSFQILPFLRQTGLSFK